MSLFFPIVIDTLITHTDPRIPDWIKHEYNIRPITRPTAAVRRIEQRLREVSWEKHPRMKARHDIFVGRNEIVKEFENRFDDIDKALPKLVVASGLREIGRKSTIKHCLKKANIIKGSYTPVTISLSQTDSIESLISKLLDLGFSEFRQYTDLSTLTLEEKIGFCANLFCDFYELKEKIILEDNNCLTIDGEIKDWFIQVIKRANYEGPVVSIATQSRLKKHVYRNNETICFLDIPEMDGKERIGLLKRLGDHLELGLRNEDLKEFRNILTGYPSQVTMQWI